MKKIYIRRGITLVAICAGLGFVSITNIPATAAPSSNTLPLKDSSTQKYLGNQFRCGFYYYKTSSSRLYANVTLQEIEDDINRMADLGFNYVYAKVDLAEGKTKYPRLERLLQTSLQRKMAVRILWSGTASLRQALVGDTGEWKPSWNAERLASNAVPFIKKYSEYPNIVDFSVDEEPNSGRLKPLHEYYQAILKRLPGTSLSLLYNRVEIAQEDKDDRYPTAIGHDNYPFKMAGVRTPRTPSFALEFFASQMDAIQQLAQHRGQAFEAVFSGFVQQNIFPENSTISNTDMRRAKAGNQGFSLNEDNRVSYFSRYRPPENATTAMCWLSLAKGADSMSIFTWSPSRDIDDVKKAYVLGWDNKGSRVLDEFAAFAKTIRPFGKLMRSISRDITSFTLPEKAGSIVPIAPKSNPVIQTTGQDIVWDSFTVPGYQGKMAIVVNTKIGTWSDGKSPLVLGKDTPFLINDKGELTDFVPFTGKREVQAKVLLPNVEAIDLLTGTKIPVDADGNVKLDIAPGAGKIVFFSTKGSGETQKLIKEYGLQ